MGARRRNTASKAVQEASSDEQTQTEAKEKKPQGNSFADLLFSISDYLFHLLRDVEKLQTFTEKVSFTAIFHCLADDLQIE